MKETPKLISKFIEYYPSYASSDFMELVKAKEYKICNNYILSVVNLKLDNMLTELKELK